MEVKMKTYSEQRPWGGFEQFCLNRKATVKIIHVASHAELSLQFHHHRDEFWRVIDGQGIIVIGDEMRVGKKGDEFFIPCETTHQIKTEGSTVDILEISFGDFDEDDIVRLSDKYGRV
jgi:mannose-6-phosphate isomerase-like protein (cupin superfamily)